MRHAHSNRRLPLAGLILLGLLAGCSEFDEGVNAENVHGTVRIPKAVVSSSEGIGMIYVGVYAGVDSHLGYPSPEAAPSSSSAGADTFPYGGTSVGTFTTRDAREVCEVVSDRTVVETDDAWEIEFDILQFPFYEGAAVWAFADQDFTSCNSEDGFYDFYSVNVDLADVTDDGPDQYVVTLAETDLSDFPSETAGEKWELIDEAERVYSVDELDDETDTLVVLDLGGYGRAPEVDGSRPARITRDTEIYYGTQFNDVLNFPGTYIGPGDIVVGTEAILNDLGAVTITLDTVVE